MTRAARAGSGAALLAQVCRGTAVAPVPSGFAEPLCVMLRQMRMRCLRGFALAAVVVLASGCGDTDAPSADGPAQPQGGPSCGDTAVDAPPDMAIEWAEYLRFGDRVYAASRKAEPAPVLGERLGAVTCTRSSSRTPVNHLIQDGEAAYLEVGTEFHAIAGRSPDEAITAVFNGEQLVFTLDRTMTAQLADAQRPASDVLDVPTDASSAEVCKAPSIVDLPNTDCKQLGADAAGRLAAALDGTPPFGVGEPCGKGDGRVYKIALGRQRVSREFIVYTPCGPLTEGARRFRVTDELSRVLIREHEDA